MRGFTAEAAQQVNALALHYTGKDRVEALQNLRLALQLARRVILENPAGGLPAPRPYPDLARPDRAWVKAGRYWVSYATQAPHLINAVFHDSADISTRAGSMP